MLTRNATFHTCGVAKNVLDQIIGVIVLLGGPRVVK
jgi:hypothetical protein